ncbi:MAG: tripartite tricarboxylate transporter TctB family protein [Methylobacterium sp.]|nr:tripartite tricarboxylate transporter TctB family protein [Methylobacterium sp.]MCA3673213.1 tripartite tricarboxylate transporter TctB family protein [Methylobacterium sp.]MCA3673680.1 tripartite tricarboxylate transporter TctB family protein [Methylobacterium sp.]MCA3677268.1 tripartite tricarboxylate transporter TctB family protein [Methylobacterium sp.]MCA3679617.1 tripartite tricarboxylate transporter TctB family protein [Methylobacterium sp.]
MARHPAQGSVTGRVAAGRGNSHGRHDGGALESRDFRQWPSGRDRRFFFVSARRLPPPDEAGIPGAGTVPAALGLVVLICGLVLAIEAFRKADRAVLDVGGKKQAVALACLILGAAFFEAAGFMLSTFLFLGAGFTMLGNARWQRALPAAAFVSVLLWLIFTKLLGVGLPFGMIAEILFR